VSADAEDSPEPDPPAPPLALIHAELARLAASPLFRRSPRHVRFLRHLVQCTVDGQTARLRELALGVEVFLRSPQRFDPRSDSIVRVEARRLRHKLTRYYAEDGADARLEFALRPGRYDVELRRRAANPGPRGSVAVFDLAMGAHGAHGAHGARVSDADDEGHDSLRVALGAELAAAMARLNGLRVVRAGALPAGGDAAALQHARNRLKVEHLVCGQLDSISPGSDGQGRAGQGSDRQGSDRQGSDRQGSDGPGHLLSLRLLRCDDGQALWSRQANVPAEGALQALQPLARGIVSTLHRDAAQRQLQRVRLAGSAPLLRALADGGPTPEGLDRLGLARIALRRHGVDGCRKAVALCEQAVALMPGHAPAFALLAEALIAGVGLTALPALPTLVAARSAAERALELDAELPDANGQLGFLLLVHQRDWPAAEARLLRALQQAPALASAHARYGWSLMMHGRLAEARACYLEARDLDPLSLLYRVHEALIGLYQRDWPGCQAALDDVLDVAPDHLVALSLHAALQLYAGRPQAGLAAYQALQQRAPGLTIGLCGSAQAQALLGRHDLAGPLLNELLAAHDNGQASPYQIAMVHTRLGDTAAALHWLAEAARLIDFNYVCVAMDPAFDVLRPLPAFDQLLRSTGFAHRASPA
jgi:tetratricopeptide (TPR) repeat protein